MPVFEIESGVDMPNSPAKRGRPMAYPWPDMQVGESVLADGEAASPGKCKAYNSAQSWGRNNGARFAGRYVGDGKVRIWRVE